MDDLGIAATVRDHVSDWTPDGSESGLDDYRRSLRDHLDRRLNPTVLGSGGHVVETHRSGAEPDVTVDGAVAILVEPVVSADGQGRLRTQLNRFEDQYGLLVVVAVEVRDEAAWASLQEHYSGDGTVTTDFVFLEAPAPSGSAGRAESGDPLDSPLAARWGGHVFIVGVLALLSFGLLTLYSWVNPDTYPVLVEWARWASVMVFIVVLAFVRFAWIERLRRVGPF